MTIDNDGFQSVEVSPENTVVHPAAQAPQKKSNTWWIVLIVVLVLLCCCAMAALLVVLGLVASGEYQIDWTGLLPVLLSWA